MEPQCLHPTSFHDGRLVAGADRQHLQHSACGPQKLLISVGPHYVYQGLGSTTGQNDQLEREGTVSPETQQMLDNSAITELLYMDEL